MRRKLEQRAGKETLEAKIDGSATPSPPPVVKRSPDDDPACLESEEEL
jgi:hypothetical protein